MMLPLLTLALLYCPASANMDYHATVITEKSLCAIPKDNGALMKCTTTKGPDLYQPVDCNQKECSCTYFAKNFEQACVFNQTYSFVRKCTDFQRNCTLFNSVSGGLAECQEKYGSCEIISEPVSSRFGVGYPQYNPPICYPGLIAAKDACNYTATSCSGDITIEFENTVRSTLLSCQNKCEQAITSCTNYTKTCSNALTYWDETARAADVDETCDTITNKCIEQREIKWIPTKNKVNERSMQHASHQSKQQSIVVKSYNCSVKSNLSASLDRCRDSINKNMKYKPECQMNGVLLTEYFFKSMYAANTTVSSVTSYLVNHWEGVSKELCRLDCFRSLTRELRFCIADLPLQNVLPGVTTLQFQLLMYRSEDLLCASTKEKEIKETCAVYLDGESEQSKNVIMNMSDSCSTERAQWEDGGRITCTQKCKKYLQSSVINRHDKPGCCLADLIKFRQRSSPWMEMLAPDVFRKHYLLNIMRDCSLTESIGSCTEVDSMHPAVIFVIAVIGVFSIVLVAGVIVFIVVFYRQMEYEGYKKGFLANIVK